MWNYAVDIHILSESNLKRYSMNEHQLWISSKQTTAITSKILSEIIFIFTTKLTKHRPTSLTCSENAGKPNLHFIRVNANSLCSADCYNSEAGTGIFLTF